MGTLKRYGGHLNGFALPTVLIASVIMLMVLMAAVTSTESVRVALVAKYYNQLAQTTGDAGTAYAKACLLLNNNIPRWSNSSPLMPNTDCTGTQLTGFTCPATSVDPRCSVMINGDIKSSFSVPLPVLDSNGKATVVTSSGQTSLLRTSDGSTWRRYTQSEQIYLINVTTVPNAPTNLSATGGVKQEGLRWSAPSNNGGSSITGYKVYRSTTSGTETLVATLGNVLTFTDTGLAYSTTYYYKVTAVNSVGESTLSSEANSITVATLSLTYNNTSTGTTGTIQNWTVPYTGVYTIEVWGAQGGDGSNGGLGADIKGDVTLYAGTILKILVGQRPSSSATSGGGGGGSFVTDNSNNPLIIAGGGGGSLNSSSSADPRINGQAGTSGANSLDGTGIGGSAGAGGTGSSDGWGGGGGGLTGNGGNAVNCSGTGGTSFTNGGIGGGTCSASTGGFGGGGGTHGNTGGGGGGGGYSGGGGSDQNLSVDYGGGGGSYNAGINQVNTAGVRSGQGLVTIHN
jgi:hypothetical protein